MLASGGSDKRLEILSLETGALETDADMGYSVHDVVFSPSGERLALGVANRVAVWDRAARKVVRDFPARLFAPFTVSRDGRLLAVATLDGVTLYGLESGGQRGRLDVGGEVCSLAFSSDGSTVAVANGTGTIHLWKVADGTRLALTIENANLYEAVFGPDGATLAASGRLNRNSSDGAIWIWELPSRKERPRIRFSGSTSRVPIAFSPSGETLALGTSDGTVRIWDAHTGQQKRQIPAHRRGVMRVAFSPDGTHIASASADGTVRLWDVVTGAPWVQAPSHWSSISSLAFSQDSRRLISGGLDSTARLWDVETGKQLLELGAQEFSAGHDDWVTAVAFAEAAGVIVTGSWNTVRFWDLATGTLLAKAEAHQGWTHGMAVLPDGRTVVTGGDRDARIRFWDASSGRPVLQLEGSDISCFAASGDGETLVTGSNLGELRIWRRPKREWQSNVLRGHRKSGHGSTRGLWESSSVDWVTSVAISRDGRTIASGSYNGSLYVWEASTGKRTREVVRAVAGNQSAVTEVAFSNDGALLAWYAKGDSIVITDLATGHPVGRLRSRNYAEGVSLAFAPDGRHLAVGSDDGTILIWSLSSVLGSAPAP